MVVLRMVALRMVVLRLVHLVVLQMVLLAVLHRYIFFLWVVPLLVALSTQKGCLLFGLFLPRWVGLVGLVQLLGIMLRRQRLHGPWFD
jgi:hypothetical protein